MSTTNYLFIRSLITTIPDSFVYAPMRANFSQMVTRCGISNRLSTTNFRHAPAADKALRPIAYEQLTGALPHDQAARLLTLQDNSRRAGYWFFNVFMIPRTYDGPHLVNNPQEGLVVGTSGAIGIDFFRDFGIDLPDLALPTGFDHVAIDHIPTSILVSKPGDGLDTNLPNQQALIAPE